MKYSGKKNKIKTIYSMNELYYTIHSNIENFNEFIKTFPFICC